MAEWFVSSAVLAALLIGAHYLLRGKISARLQYALWLVLLVRLLLPLSVGKTALSVANLLPEAEPAAVIQAEPAAVPPAQAARTPEPAAPAAPVQTPVQPVQRPASTPAQAGTDSAEPEKSAQKPAVSVRKIFLLVWASGAALLGLWFLFCNLRYGRQLRAGVLRAIAPKEGRPAVRLTQTALSPCLFGLFTPAIYVTMDCAQDEQLLHHCAEHEYTHYLHRDHIWAVLRGVCLALHWFNPLVWWAAALSRTDAELFCDEDTVRRLGEDARVDYGRSLIRMTCRERVDPLSAATTMSGRGGQLKTRIISITKHPKTAIPVLILVLLLCAAAVGCTMTGAKDAAPAQQTPERTENTPEELEATADTREEPEAAVEFTTTQDTVTLSVPARYENEITADDSFMIEAPETGEHDLDDVLFSFYDKSQAAEDRLGLVWAIRAFQFEDPAELVKDGADRWVEENLMALNTHLLGTRGSTAYYFFCLSPSDKAVRQYDSSDTAAVSSYYQHAADGLDILKDFVVRNGLAPVEGAVDWEAWYQEFILPRIEAETDPAADAAWFAAREPVEQWPEFTVNGTSIYDLTLDELTPAFGKPTRIYHWMDIGTEYYDVVQFPDASQIAGWIDEDGTIHHPDGSQAAGWVGEDGELHHLNAAYLRLESGTEVCGIRYSWNYFAAANLFPRDAEPVLEQIDEHTTRLRLGGEITYMGKYSYIEYTDGAATTLVVSDETLMTFYIENGVIAAVSWMAPEESMRLPVTEEWVQQRMTIDPSRLTDENLLSILIGPEIALVNNGFTFDSPADLSSEKLFMLFLYWSVDSTRDNYKQADGKYHFTQDFINGILSHYFRTGSFTFDITQCRNYDASDGTAVIENVSGFGGDRDLRIADVQVLGGSTVQVTADFYNADPFFDNSGGELRYARKVYTLDFYYGGALFQSAQFAALPEDDLRAALKLHTGETTDDLAQLFWTYDGQNRNLLGSLPDGNWTALPLTEDAWDGLSLFVYECWARENNWPLTISETDFDHTLVRYFPLGRYGWEDRSSHYLTYQDGTYTRTINDNHGARYCYLKSVSSLTDGSFQLVFRCLDVPELTEYADASADVRAVYDHAGAEELQPQEFRRAVYRAFADGVIPTGNSMTELTVTVRLTGEARYPFQFLSARDG